MLTEQHVEDGLQAAHRNLTEAIDFTISEEADQLDREALRDLVRAARAAVRAAEDALHAFRKAHQGR